MELRESLHLMEGATRSFRLSEFSGTTVAIDADSWFRQGINEGRNIEQLPNFCLQYIDLLHSHDIRPILIFDGRQLPMRQPNAKQRIYDEAYFKLKGLEIAGPLIKLCHSQHIDCLVAPYEAAAQIAFFNLRGIAELVISENFDLVLFGCSKICLKLDMEGFGLLLDSEKICEAVNLKSDTFEKFKHMCILSGCDYLEPLQGLSLKDAHKFINNIEETNPEIFLDLLDIPYVPEDYKEQFMMADAIFRHQVIFNPFSRKLEHLFDPHIAGTNPKYCVNVGEIYDQETAYQVALGNLHPCTMEKLNNWDPKAADLTNRSIWCEGQYQKSPQKNLQKDSFKQYFSSYKFETINEADADDTTQKTDESQAGISGKVRAEPVPSSKTDTIDNSLSPGASGTVSSSLPPFATLTKFAYPRVINYTNIQSGPTLVVAGKLAKDFDDVMPPLMPRRREEVPVPDQASQRVAQAKFAAQPATADIANFDKTVEGLANQSSMIRLAGSNQSKPGQSSNETLANEETEKTSKIGQRK